ncbi:MAG: TIGR03905 family TSCPD domain-containing protein [Oscillospiraceae bacterium]|nr:TIGR03905 family TSCPD domain-containing protein [Oscillospiraceae bacterium]
MHYEYKTHGVCSAKILFDLEGGVVNNIRFIGGCSGNTQGVAALANGRPVDEVISILQGIRCGYKPTSCPDQLAQALLAAKEQQ